ncbi:MAG: PBP1A family penicillin-binding protein [Candidatus Lernaella stagnicola]|nr:PBP1A family penicillin-binding protein [Candidatus Lernaella stagnicola]
MPQGKPLLMRPHGRNHKWHVLLNFVVTGILGAAVAAGIFAFVFYNMLAVGLPKIDSLDDYRPNLVTEVRDRHGELIGEFMYENQRRYLISAENLPEHVVYAFVSAEDKTFFEHEGIDYWGIARAAIANLRAGEIKQGGSTITQQVVKSLLLTPEKTYSRKMREMILAKRIEDRLSKEDILYLYLNQIYFGGGAYGVEAAARAYLGKSAAQLSVAEAALLAGLVQAPGRYSPRTRPERAMTRRHYVLTRLLEDGRITAEEFQTADAQPLTVLPWHDINKELAPDYVEFVRRYLMEQYGAEKVLQGGLRVTTACDLELQRAARAAVDLGLRQHAKRQGILALPPVTPREQWPEAMRRITRINAGKDATQVREGLVIGLDDIRRTATVDVGGGLVDVPLAKIKWATRIKRGRKTTSVTVRRPSDLLRPGDRVQVYRESKGGAYVLAAWPAAEAALLSMEVRTRHVLAMIGGADFEQSEFNRAVQARRQPGSAFKPIVYAAAVNAGLTAATVFPDTALVFSDNWRPANYDRRFRGYMSLREALTRSINTVTIRVADMIGVDYLTAFAKRVGLHSLTGGDLSMAIGTYEITPLELVNAFGVFASGGVLTDPVFVLQVADADGNLLEEAEFSDFVEQTPPLAEKPDLRAVAANNWPDVHNNPLEDPMRERRLMEFLSDFGVDKTTPEDEDEEDEDTPEPHGEIPISAIVSGKTIRRQVVDPQVSFVITDMMHSVASRGTGAKSNVLGRVLAGKTGTTNDYADAWFVGFSPEVLAGVWVGYDRGGKSLGRSESGSTTALPIWIDYMRNALKGREPSSFAAPTGLVYARIDPETGLLAHPDAPGVNEMFVAGTEPTEYAPNPATPNAADFFDLEFEGDLE